MGNVCGDFDGILLNTGGSASLGGATSCTSRTDGLNCGTFGGSSLLMGFERIHLARGQQAAQVG